MKLSIAWIFDHIDVDWQKQNIKDIVTKFNQVTAEIESYEEYNLNLEPFALGVVVAVKDDVEVKIPEWGKDISLPMRKDAQVGSVFVVKKDRGIRWAVCKDLDLDKDGVLPAFDVEEKLLSGGWKKLVETKDIILEVDNKSVTHRPDMWGHRGFAREIAAFMGLPFRPKENFLANQTTIESEHKSEPYTTNPFVVENKAPNACFRFAGLYFPSIENKPANLFMAFRLMRLGSRSINTLVDLTNYLMLDWSQPTHAFDAEKVADKKVIIRMASKGEKLVLLDGVEVELTKDDLVIADAEKAIALGGIMGGLADSVSDNTTSIFLESANFNPTTIRRTALRHKCRTEASTRFEKTLDPNQNTEGIERFLFLLKQFGIKASWADEMVSLGKRFEEPIIGVSHDYLTRRAGFDLKEADIVKPLERLGFKVTSDELYNITVPSFRGAKDVTEKEDILEEVVRFYGFNNVKLVLPVFEKKASSFSGVSRQRKLKSFLANAAHMTEQQNYVLYDEDFLKQINYKPRVETITLINPISENNTTMITSLVPGLLKNVVDNFMFCDDHYFFEVGRTWCVERGMQVERKSVAGIFFHKRTKVDFYQYKEHIDSLLRSLGIIAEWKKASPSEPWMSKYQTASLFDKGEEIGFAGKADVKFLAKLDVLPESEAFIFEINGDYLLSYVPEINKFKPLSKYQEVSFDLSAFAPLNITTKEIEKVLGGVDPIVEEVVLIDFFEKEEWQDKRSLAFRIRLSHPEKTLEKEEIEAIRGKAIKALEKLGMSLRV